MKASWKSAGRRRQNSCSMSRPCRVELPVGFGNRWKTTRTVVASRDTGRGRSFGQVTDLLATPAGFEPATLSLEGCQITLIDKHNFSKWTLNRRLSIGRGQEKTTYPPPRATCELRGNLVRSAVPLQNACYATISGVSTDLPWH
jgi:hypothetical protein